MNYPFTLCSLRLTTKPIMTSESIGVLALCVLLLAVSLLLGKYHSYSVTVDMTARVPLVRTK